jgi:hypothetical protein
MDTLKDVGSGAIGDRQKVKAGDVYGCQQVHALICLDQLPIFVPGFSLFIPSCLGPCI